MLIFAPPGVYGYGLPKLVIKCPAAFDLPQLPLAPHLGRGVLEQGREDGSGCLFFAVGE